MKKGKNMTRNIIIYIFIYIFVIGCSSDGIFNQNDSGCGGTLEVSAPSLEVDGNGYYHIDFLQGYVQTFSTLKTSVGYDGEKVGWISNKEVLVGNTWTNCIDAASYSDSNGNAYGVLSVWEGLVGDTITVYVGYTDDCSEDFTDSIYIIVD